jgi:two-component sensor histidine kinase
MGLTKGFTIVGRAAIAAIVSMFLALSLVLGFWLHSSYMSAVRRGEDQVTATAKIVAANAIWINSLARQTLHRMDDAFGTVETLPDEERVRRFNAATAELPTTATAYVVAADGTLLYSTDRESSPADIVDQTYFRRLANGAEDHTSAMTVMRNTDRHVFLSAARIERNDKFEAVAILAFDVGMLRSIWDAASLGPGSTVSFLRRDGKLIARYPEPKEVVDLGNYILFTDYMRKATSDSYVSVSPVDGVERLVAYRIVERTPFVAIASADTAAILKPFWTDVSIAALIVLLALCAAVVGGLKILSLAHADAHHTAELAEALRTNQVLMREIHHRVKNNLQTVMALIRLQGLRPETVQRVNERIVAMSAVHEQMYGFDQFSSVTARQFVPNLVRTLVGLHDREIQLTFEIDDIRIDADKATPFALLLNELLTNSMKYAFDGRDDGHIRIRLLDRPDGKVLLEVADDGVGYEPVAAKTGMGSRLIKSFVSQMDGTYATEQAQGTVFTALLSIAVR